MLILKKWNLVILFLISLFSLTGCLKTAAEIERDQEVEQVLMKARESDSLVAELTAKNKEMQEQINALQGKVDELQQGIATGKTTTTSATNATTEQQLKLVADVEDIKTNMAKLQKDVEAQQEYIKKTDGILKGLTSVPIDAETYDHKKNGTELSIDDAEKLLADKKYDETLKACKELLNSKISDGKKNRCRYAQGMAYKELKQYDEALLSLSQIYTDWPKSSLAPNSLLEIGKILETKGQKKEAQLMFKKLINEYPKTSSAKDAKKLVKL